MAITVIGGLLVSTLLTLLVIPVVYDLLDRRPDEHYVRRAKSLPELDADEPGDDALHRGAQA
jgi:HAE1 family hydrophobic/amphiphilic exporter-1